MRSLSPQMLGAVCAIIATIIFSFNDVVVKFLSGGYALHQVVLIRSLIAIVVVCLMIAPFSVGWQVWRTKRPGLHMVRGLCVVFANMTFFLGLAAMPLADAVAIFFVTPIVITLASVLFLGEAVGPRRWVAIVVGFVGVLVMMRPGTDAFQLASLLPLAAAFFYASIHIITRKMGMSENAVTMVFYIQVMFIVVCLAMGLAFGDGRFGDQTDPSLQFLLRAWVWPEASDIPYFLMIGLGIGFGGWLISQAYRVSEASFVAPFEYLALPISVVWGIVVFAEYPQPTDYLGMVLILGAGLFMIWRDAVAKRATLERPIRR